MNDDAGDVVNGIASALLAKDPRVRGSPVAPEPHASDSLRPVAGADFEGGRPLVSASIAVHPSDLAPVPSGASAGIVRRLRRPEAG